MKVAIVSASILAAGIALASFAYGGRYQMQKGPDYFVFRLDRFTGNVAMCGPDEATGGVACVESGSPAVRKKAKR